MTGRGDVEDIADAIVGALDPAATDRVAEVVGALGPAAPGPRIRAYAVELLRCTALQSANSDPTRPRVHVSLYPGARAGLDNPDTRYRFVPLSARHRYEIHGRRNDSTDVSFQLFDAWQGDGVIGEQLAFLPGSDLVLDADGRFTITLDAAPAGGRPCHVQLPPGAAQLTVRDTLADWTLRPMELQVLRVDDATPAAPPSIDELAARTLDRALVQAAFWPPIVDAFRLLPPSSLGPPNPTPGGLANQCSAPGRFDLTDDAAMVIRMGPGDAGYMGIQLGSLQFISIDPWSRQSSLNPSQAVPDPDGASTFVISRRDPGVANWLDPADHDAGIVFMRWQAMRSELPTSHHPTSRVVPLDRLDDELPDAPRVTPSERAERLALRRATAVPPRP